MIINIRGTSGSGKSTVMRKVMEHCGPWTAAYQEGRKQPLYYRSTGDWKNLVVLGHYESPCGGCDTIGSARQVFELIQRFNDEMYGVDENATILCEGLLLSEDTKWFSQLPDLRVYYLVTSLETCLAQIKQRRLAAGNIKELNIENTSKRVAVIERSRVKLIEAGATCIRCSARQAVMMIPKFIKEMR